MGARTHPIFTNFTMGELSPRLYGRVDWEKYQRGCVTLENFLIQPQGGVTRRPGLRFVSEVKTSATATRLIPFRMSEDTSYVLEVGNLYIRFYKNGAQLTNGVTPIEVTSPYVTADLFDIHYAQLSDTLVLVHPSYAPMRLSRYSDTVWRLATMDFDPPPSREYGRRTTSVIGGSLVPTAVSGTNVEINCTQYIFLAADVGREILDTSTGARAEITVVDSQTRVHADILDDFLTTDAIAAGDWKIDGSPLATITPSVDSPAFSYVQLTLDIDGFRSGDEGKYVILSGGVVEITRVDTTTYAVGTILVELDGTTAQPPYAWSLEEASWSALNGYPGTVGFVENRLAFGGNTEEPDALWMSASYAPLNFALGSTDDSAISIKPGSGENNRIRWISARRKCLLGTSSDEFLLGAPNDAALTPSNIRPVPSTPHGSCTVMPIKNEYSTIFLTGNRRLLREMAYSYEADDYRSPNLLDVAEHLTNTTTIVDMAFQRPPDSILWAVRSDGVLLGCTYLRDQDIVGWHRHVTDGLFESVCCIPSQDGTTEQAWFVVNRTIGGATKRYVEYFDALAPEHWTGQTGLVTDSAVTYDSTATATLTGMAHLNGETVSLVGDGAVYPNSAVAAGSATLTGSTASKIEGGLLFTSTLKSVRPEIPVSGTSQGLPRAWGPIKARFLNTIGGRIQDEIVSSPLPPTLYSGDKTVNRFVWDEDGWITVEQKQPLPMTILAIFGTLAVGD
jgi:hypothetical protein